MILPTLVQEQYPVVVSVTGSCEERHSPDSSNTHSTFLLLIPIVLGSVANDPWPGTGVRPRVLESLFCFILHLIKILIDIKVNVLNHQSGSRRFESHPVKTRFVGLS